MRFPKIKVIKFFPIFRGQRATGFFSLQDCMAFFEEQFQYLLFSVFHFPIQIAHFESSMQMWRKSPEKISTYCRKTPLNFNSFGISNIKTPSTLRFFAYFQILHEPHVTFVPNLPRKRSVRGNILRSTWEKHLGRGRNMTITRLDIL